MGSHQVRVTVRNQFNSETFASFGWQVAPADAFDPNPPRDTPIGGPPEMLVKKISPKPLSPKPTAEELDTRAGEFPSGGLIRLPFSEPVKSTSNEAFQLVVSLKVFPIDEKPSIQEWPFRVLRFDNETQAMVLVKGGDKVSER